jgi:hypothetical protein
MSNINGRAQPLNKDESSSNPSSESVEIELTVLPPKPLLDGPASGENDLALGGLGRQVIDHARAYTDAEDARRTGPTFSLWRRAVLWSIVVAFCIVLEGYDLALMPNFFSLSSFKVRKGIPEETTWKRDRSSSSFAYL